MYREVLNFNLFDLYPVFSSITRFHASSFTDGECSFDVISLMEIIIIKRERDSLTIISRDLFSFSVSDREKKI